jgi:putative membrane protein
MSARLIFTWLGNCVALAVAAALIPAIAYQNIGTLALAGVVLALVNFALRPLVMLLALPVLLLTLGLAVFLVNTLMLAVTSDVVTGLRTGGFWSTLAGAVVISVVNLALRPALRGRRRAAARSRASRRRASSRSRPRQRH